MPMKRENLNTLIASLAFALSLVTAWFQFGPVGDELEIARAQKTSSGATLEFKGDKDDVVYASQAWSIVVYNPTSRSVSIVDASLARQTDEGIQLMPNDFASFEAVAKDGGEPLAVPSNGTREFRLEFQTSIISGDDETQFYSGTLYFLLNLTTADGSTILLPLIDTVDAESGLIDKRPF